MILLFVGCGGLTSAKSVRVNSLIYDTYLEIALDVKKNKGGPEEFYCNMNIEEIKAVVDNSKIEVGSVSSTIFNDRFLLIERLLPNERIEYYMIIEFDSNDEEEHSYFLTTPNSSLDFETIIYLPLHMFEIEMDGYFNFNVEFEETYEVIRPQIDFVEFYSKIDIYDVESIGNTISIKIKNKDDIFIPEHKPPHTKEDFTITFNEVDDKLFATYTRS